MHDQTAKADAGKPKLSRSLGISPSSGSMVTVSMATRTIGGLSISRDTKMQPIGIG